LPDKKPALSKPAAKAKTTAAKNAPAARREPATKKEQPKPMKSAKATPVAKGKTATPPPKASRAPVKAAPPAKTMKPAPAPKSAPVAKKAAPKPTGKTPPVAKAAPVKETKAKAAGKADVKADPKLKAVAPDTKAPIKGAKGTKPAPEPKAEAKPAVQPKPAKPEKPAKAAKVPKEKPPKPVKLAPVAAAFAKPMPAKPMAVAAGRAQPIQRTLTTPAPKQAPKPLAAPKPVAAPEPELVGDLQAVPAFKGKTTASKGMVLVGAIAGAFGVKGEVRLRAFTDKAEGVISYGPLFGEDGKALLKPKSWRSLKDGVAVVAPEVKTREQAEAMKGQRLYVPRANLPPTAEDEFYVVDLLGCEAEAVDGQALGKIVAVWNFGAGDIIEYRPPNGGPNVRVTFTKESTPLVDLTHKRVVIDPPAPEPVGK